jgi:hypothetical protein
MAGQDVARLAGRTDRGKKIGPVAFRPRQDMRGDPEGSEIVRNPFDDIAVGRADDRGKADQLLQDVQSAHRLFPPLKAMTSWPPHLAFAEHANQSWQARLEAEETNGCRKWTRYGQILCSVSLQQ